MVLPAVTTLMGWPNYGPYGTYPQAQLYWLLLGWPLLFNKMFGYGVNQLFNLLLFPTYLPQGYSPLGRCGCVRGQASKICSGKYWYVIILAGGPSWQSETVWRVLCNSTGLAELWGPFKLLIPYSCRNSNFFPHWVGRALGTCRSYSAVLAELWGVWYVP